MKDFIETLKFTGLSARIKRLSDALNQEARAVNAYLDFDIEPNWYLIFLSLKEESLTVTELAEQLRFSHPAIVKIIKKMKDRGYIKSKQNKKDSRKQHLYLTSKSKKMLPKFEEQWQHIQEIMSECSSEKFIENLKFFEDSLKEKSILQRLKEINSDNKSIENE